jgi:hypothetical protein
MFDLRRLWGILIAATWVSLCLAFCEAAFGASSRWWPGWLKNDWARGEIYVFEMSAGRISGLEKEGFDDGRPIGVCLGSSEMDSAIDPALLGPAVDPRMRWLFLVGYATSAREMELMTQLLFKTKIKPAIIVVGLQLMMLARNPAYRNHRLEDRVELDFGPLLGHLRSLRPGTAEGDLEDLLARGFNVCFPDRTRINTRLRARLTRARITILEGMGQKITSVFRPTPNPWAPNGDVPWLERADDALLALQMKQMTARGDFDPHLYSAREEASESLVKVVRMARSKGAEVVVLVMPERSNVRARMPASAMETLTELSENAFGTDAVRVISLRDSVADDEFCDQQHLLSGAKPAFTRLVIQELNDRRTRAGTPRDGKGSGP